MKSGKILELTKNTKKIDFWELEIGEGRDEMNLVEFQIALPKNKLLQLKRQGKSEKTIKTWDWFTDVDGQRKKREWITTSSDEYGFPSERADDLMVAMLKATKDNNFKSREVPFEEREFLKLMGLGTGGKAYRILEDLFAQLKGLQVVAKNAFWDNEEKKYLPFITFGMIDGVVVEERRRGRKSKLEKEKPQGYFSWNDTYWKHTFQKNNIKFLDLNFYFSLKSYYSKRIYRYLSKHFYGHPKFEKDIFIFGQKAGLTREYQYQSQVFEKIEPHLEELKQRGFLKDYDRYYHKGYKEHHIVCIAGDKAIQEKTFQREIPLALPPVEEEPALSTSEPLDSLCSLQALAKELIQYFQQRQNRIDNYQPTSKELEQASNLLEQYGEEKTKYLIDYAIEQAQGSKFRMRRFGAVLTYLGEALPKYEHEQEERQKLERLRKQREARRKAQEEKEAKEKEELDNLYNSLKEEERAKLQVLIKQKFERLPLKPEDPSSDLSQIFIKQLKDQILQELKGNPNLLSNIDLKGQEQGQEPAVKQKPLIQEQAQRLCRFYYKEINRADHQPTTKDLQLAEDLISKHSNPRALNLIFKTLQKSSREQLPEIFCGLKEHLSGSSA